MKRTTLDRYKDRYARRVGGMRSSAMRDVMSITQRPEVISLAGGLPDTAAFPKDVLEEITTGIARESHALALQYGPTEGSVGVREAIRAVMAVEGMDVDIRNVLVTTGGQQVLDLVARTLLDPGDVVVAEGPTYPGAVPVFSSYQADVQQIPLDADGLDPDLVEAMIDDLEREGRRPKYLYTIPTFQNPAGTTMSVERRHRLVELAHERDLLILEDNPYSLLRFEGEPVPTLRSLDTHGNVMYLGTFSKIFSPGMRLGWLEAPSPILAKVNLGKQAADLCSSSYTQLLVERLFANYDWQALVETGNVEYRIRRDAMLQALTDHFPAEATWTHPHGGLFLWATLPPWIDTTDLLARALRENVAFVPGAGAYVDGRGGSSMRLNYSGADAPQITEGVRRLGAAIEEQMELARALGAAGPVVAPYVPAPASSQTPLPTTPEGGSA